MREEEYKECRYVESEMRFYTVEDFMEKREYIKRMYSILIHKVFYKWYLYSHIGIGNKIKDRMWEWLNGDIELEVLEQEIDKCKFDKRRFRR